MANIEKINGKWRAQIFVRVGGKDHRPSKTFKSKREAQVWASETKVRLRAGVDSDTTMDHVFDRYAREVSPTKRGKDKEYIRLQRFANYIIDGQRLGAFKIREIEPHHFDEYKRIRTSEPNAVKSSTVQREFNLMRNVFTYAVKTWKLIRENPMADVKNPKKGKRRKRNVSEDEITLIAGVFDLDAEAWISNKQKTGAAFLFAIETAMRAGEILALQNGHITGQVAHIPESKNGEARDVPLSHRALEIIRRVRGNRTADTDHPFDVREGTRDATFRRYVRKAEIENLVFHDSRHEAIRRLAKIFQPLDLIRITGHKNLNELLTYYDESAASMAERLNSATSKDEIK